MVLHDTIAYADTEQEKRKEQARPKLGGEKD